MFEAFYNSMKSSKVRQKTYLCGVVANEKNGVGTCDSDTSNMASNMLVDALIGRKLLSWKLRYLNEN